MSRSTATPSPRTDSAGFRVSDADLGRGSAYGSHALLPRRRDRGRGLPDRGRLRPPGRSAECRLVRPVRPHAKPISASSGKSSGSMPWRSRTRSTLDNGRSSITTPSICSSWRTRWTSSRRRTGCGTTRSVPSSPGTRWSPCARTTASTSTPSWRGGTRSPNSPPAVCRSCSTACSTTSSITTSTRYRRWTMRSKRSRTGSSTR